MPKVIGMIKVEEYEILTLNCSTYGNLPITSYKWFWNGKIIEGETEEKYLKTNFSRRDAGNYFCEVLNVLYKKTSESVAVIALCKYLKVLWELFVALPQ